MALTLHSDPFLSLTLLHRFTDAKDESKFFEDFSAVFKK